jgi:hypothetical protein
MYFIQLIPYRGQGVTVGVFESVNGNSDLAVLNIGFDQSQILANFERHACAPDEANFNLLVHAGNEAGDDAGGQDGIGIFKGRHATEFQFSGFVFGELDISIFFLNVFHSIEAFEMFILRPESGIMQASGGKNNTICHGEF